MLRLFRARARRASLGRYVIGVLALVAQGWIAFAAIGERSGFGAPSHTEAAGIVQHAGHDEALCPSCTVLAMHVLPRPARAPLVAIERLSRLPIVVATQRVACASLRAPSSRAPPTA